MADIRVPRQNGVDVPRKFSSFIFVDRMRYISRRALDVDFTPNASFRDMVRRACASSGTRVGSLNRVRNFGRSTRVSKFRDELYDAV